MSDFLNAIKVNYVQRPIEQDDGKRINATHIVIENDGLFPIGRVRVVTSCCDLTRLNTAHICMTGDLLSGQKVFHPVDRLFGYDLGETTPEMFTTDGIDQFAPTVSPRAPKTREGSVRKGMNRFSALIA